MARLALRSQYVTQQQEEWLVSHMYWASLENEKKTIVIYSVSGCLSMYDFVCV